jgi:hypothetical protein
VLLSSLRALRPLRDTIVFIFLLLRKLGSAPLIVDKLNHWEFISSSHCEERSDVGRIDLHFVRNDTLPFMRMQSNISTIKGSLPEIIKILFV